MIRTVHVTQEDIDQGKAQDREACPLALALTRLTGEPWYVYVACVKPARNYGPYGSYEPTIVVPASASAFVMAFDRGAPVAPFSFDLEFPDGPA